MQFGGGFHCDNKNDDRSNLEARIESGERGSANAECAIMTPRGKLFDLQFPLGNESPFDTDEVTHNSTPAEILELMNFAARQPSEGEPISLEEFRLAT